MKLTIETLQAEGACVAQRELFAKTFPNGVVVTKARCVKYAQVFNFDWAAGALLTPNGLKAYNEAVDPARKVLNEAVTQARKVLDEAMAQAWKAHDEAVAPARKVLDEAVASAEKAYNEAVAIAFYDATRIK